MYLLLLNFDLHVNETKHVKSKTMHGSDTRYIFV